MFENEAPYIPLDIAQYKAMRDAKTPHLLLDVREPMEYAQAQIAGATLVPMNDVMWQVDDLRAHDQIVVVCRSCSRSAMGPMILRYAGQTGKVYNMKAMIID